MLSRTISLSQLPTNLCPEDSRWPPQLNAVSPRPSRLRVAGVLPALDCAVGIVGTRAASGEAIRFTEAFARHLACAGCVVVSGGAHGIDAAAHQGALDGGGKTVAVLASGLAHAYPPSHGALFSRIAAQGALVTETHHDDVAPIRARFIQRNRIIAALVKILIVIEAPSKSGALSTASVAKKLKIPVLAVPGCPWDPRATGCLHLLKDGAQVCISPRDALTVLGMSCELPRVIHSGEKGQGLLQAAHGLASSGPLARIYEALRENAASVDDLIERTGLSAPDVQKALLHLSMRGEVEQDGGGRYFCCSFDSTPKPNSSYPNVILGKGDVNG